jgi:methionine sulfoxide reductase heme-binding subunit
MAKQTGWIDTLSLIFSVVMIGLFAVWTMQGGFITRVLETDRSMTWQFIRSSGMTAYILFTISTLWGLALSSKIVKDWSPGTLSMLLHTTVSWLGVGFAALHAFMLLFDEYVPYQPVELAIPFIGPYRPLAVGLGTLSFWIMLLVALSFKFKKQLGHHRWKLLHYTSYAGFFMVTAHALFAGTDAGKIGFRILLGVAVLVTMILTSYRVGMHKPTAQPARARQGA